VVEEADPGAIQGAMTEALPLSARKVVARPLTLGQQELSYRKQIARQYVEGFCWPKYYTVTLKCRLRITEGH